MYKVFIGVGHGGIDSGAVGILVEKTVNLVEALACRDLLESYGIQVLMSRTDDSNDPLKDEIKECNAFNPDLAVDIHNNAGGGDGFEAFYHYKGGKGKDLALNIEEEVKAIGQNSRGCKTCLNSSGTDYFGFIREINCPSIILEGCFVDNQKDAEIASTLEKQKSFGYAYARGILKTLGINLNDNISPPENSSLNTNLYKVQIGAYSKKENAQAQLEKAKSAGFSDAFII